MTYLIWKHVDDSESCMSSWFGFVWLATSSSCLLLHKVGAHATIFKPLKILWCKQSSSKQVKGLVCSRSRRFYKSLNECAHLQAFMWANLFFLWLHFSVAVTNNENDLFRFEGRKRYCIFFVKLLFLDLKMCEWIGGHWYFRRVYY